MFLIIWTKLSLTFIIFYVIFLLDNMKVYL